MPTATYEELLVETVPARIDTEQRYESICACFGDLLGKPYRTAAEDKLMDLLGVLILDYDRRHSMPPEDSTPEEILQFLVEQSGKAAHDLLMPVFGEPSHVSEALNGQRRISAEQARELGRLFSVKPGLFV
jgi:HTH-type transcriptional regulator/antitoxin HigA